MQQTYDKERLTAMKYSIDDSNAMQQTNQFERVIDQAE